MAAKRCTKVFSDTPSRTAAQQLEDFLQEENIWNAQILSVHYTAVSHKDQIIDRILLIYLK